MSRGVLWIVWDGYEKRTRDALERSRNSVAQWHPELPQHTVTLPADSTILDKSAMLDMTPFDETLFLDADTVVLGRLDYAFDKAVQHGLACCICECPWARRYPSCSGDQVEYNAGIMWFTKKAKPVFDRWQDLSHTVDSSIEFVSAAGLQKMPHNDQAPLTLAIEETGFNPWVLPLNWNFRPLWHKTWFGPIKIWHDYSPVTKSVLDFTTSQSEPGAMILYARAET